MRTTFFFEFITIFRKYVMFDVHFKMGQIGFLKLELFKLNQLVITGHWFRIYFYRCLESDMTIRSSIPRKIFYIIIFTFVCK